MNILNRFAFILGLAGTILLPIFFWADLISTKSMIANGMAAISLLAAGTALVLTEDASGLLKYAILFCAWTGFLVLAGAAYQFIELNASWQMGVSLLSIALVSGITQKLDILENAALKWVGVICAILLVIVAVCIFFKIENQLIFSSGAIVLSVFSVLSIVATFVRRKAQD